MEEPVLRLFIRQCLLAIAGASLVIPIASYVTGWIGVYLVGVQPTGFGSDSFSTYSSLLGMIFGTPAFILYLYLLPKSADSR
jgi:hypothetical protein